MGLSDKEQIARKNLLRRSEEERGVRIEGYDFDEGVEFEKIIKSYGSTGFQAIHLSKAIEITREMIKENAFIFLGYTSNMVSSGLRDIFRWLVKHKKVNVVVTTAGGIEEDIIKCLGDFTLGDFRASGKELRKRGINRIGNIYAPNNRYIEFEEFVQPIIQEMWGEQKKTGRIFSPGDLIWKLGEKINDEKSICYWAWKNKIRIYCPAITDGALGDNIYFAQFKHQKNDALPRLESSGLFGARFSDARERPHLERCGFQRSRHEDFVLDIVKDIVEFNNMTIGLKKSGVIILGGGVMKHAILNANMLRNGADYAVYINTAQEFDGSDAGALPEEAISWGKILGEGKSVKVFVDATIVFPLLVAESFASIK